MTRTIHVRLVVITPTDDDVSEYNVASCAFTVNDCKFAQGLLFLFSRCSTLLVVSLLISLSLSSNCLVFRRPRVLFPAHGDSRDNRYRVAFAYTGRLLKSRG